MLKKKTAILALLLYVYACLLVYLFYLDHLKRLNAKQNAKRNISIVHQEKLYSKRFLYLTQVKDCLRSYFLQQDVLGSGDTHDVLALSYSKLCGDNKHDHIKYIEAGRKTTWTQGRNLLYKYVSQEKDYQHYQYYIFFDEDARLVNNDLLFQYGLIFDKTAHGLYELKESPWRKYENFLQNYEPAIGIVDQPPTYERLFVQKGSNIPKAVPAYVSGYSFDAMFNGFHREVLDTLLPYNESKDAKSWHASQQFMKCRIFFRFHGQMVIFTPLLSPNDQHNPYPRIYYTPQQICPYEFSLAPRRIQDSPSSKALLNKQRTRETQLFSYVAPPKTDKVSYKYFDKSFVNGSF